MRMLAQDGAFYRKPRVDGTDDPEALRRLRIVEGVDRMRERFTAAEAAEAFEVSRTTCYEWRRRLWKGGVKRLAPAAAGRGRTAAGVGRRRTPGGCFGCGAGCRGRGRRGSRRRSPGAGRLMRWVGRILRRMVARGRALPCSFCEGRVATKPRDSTSVCSSTT